MTQTNQRTLVIIPGDGIGPEIIGQATRVVEWFDRHRGLGLDIKQRQLGVNVYEKHGTLTQDETLETIEAADATLFGAIGGDGYDDIPRNIRVETGLLSVRRQLAMFANIRPVVTFDALADATSLKPEVVRGTDMIILRELNGGLYFGEPRGIEDIGGGNRRGVNSMVYTTPEIRRVARVGFELAKARGILNSGTLLVDRAGSHHRHEPLVLAVQDSAEMPPAFQHALFNGGCGRKLIHELGRRYQRCHPGNMNVGRPFCPCRRHACASWAYRQRKGPSRRG